MPTRHPDPTAALLLKINRNIGSLSSAVDEIRLWMERQGELEASKAVRVHLSDIEASADDIAAGISDLIVHIAQHEVDQR